MNLTMIRDHLEQAHRHVALGEQHIQRQREIVAQLGTRGRDTRNARDLLSLFEATQELHVAGRDRLAQLLAKATDR